MAAGFTSAASFYRPKFLEEMNPAGVIAGKNIKNVTADNTIVTLAAEAPPLSPKKPSNKKKMLHFSHFENTV